MSVGANLGNTLKPQQSIVGCCGVGVLVFYVGDGGFGGVFGILCMRGREDVRLEVMVTSGD